MERKNKNPTPSLEQGDYLQAISEYIADRGYSPSVKDIIAAVGVKSPNSAQEMIVRLVLREWIKVDRGVSRSIRLTNLGRSFVVLSDSDYKNAIQLVKITTHQDATALSIATALMTDAKTAKIALDKLELKGLVVRTGATYEAAEK